MLITIKMTSWLQFLSFSAKNIIVYFCMEWADCLFSWGLIILSSAAKLPNFFERFNYLRNDKSPENVFLISWQKCFWKSVI